MLSIAIIPLRQVLWITGIEVLELSWIRKDPYLACLRDTVGSQWPELAALMQPDPVGGSWL